jgi:uncharacterized FlaG/YvyC family protein
MASGIDNLVSAVSRSVSVPLGPAAHPAAPSRVRTQRHEVSPEMVGRSTQEKDSRKADWEDMVQAGKKTLAALSEYAQKAALASETSIIYQRDEQNGKMYLHVVDKHTGKELYRIPRDYFSPPDAMGDEPHQLNVQV